MKVYIVTAGEYSDYHIEQVFSQETPAREYAKRTRASAGEYDFAKKSARVEIYAVDDLAPLPWKYVTMRRDGVVDSVGDGSDNEDYINGDEVLGVFFVQTDSSECAIKVASERRAQLIAEDQWKSVGWRRAVAMSS